MHPKSFVKRKALVQKRLADFFPEEHIVVTSGLVLVIVAFLTITSEISPQGYSVKLASTAPTVQTMVFTLWDAFLFGLFALVFVFGLVYVVNRYAGKVVEKKF